MWGTYDRDSEGMGDFRRGETRKWKYKWTDHTTDYHRKQESTRQVSINHTCVHVHLQKKSNKICTLGSRGLKVDEFPVSKLFECLPAPAICSRKETALIKGPLSASAIFNAIKIIDIVWWNKALFPHLLVVFLKLWLIIFTVISIISTCSLIVLISKSTTCCPLLLVIQHFYTTE